MHSQRTLGLALVIAASCAANAGSITPALERAIKADPYGSTPVIILLKNQPGYYVSRDVTALYRPEIDRLGQRVREISKGMRPVGPIRPEFEKRTPERLSPAAEAERLALLEDIDRYDHARIEETVRRINMLVASDLSATDAFIRSRGGRVDGVTTVVTAMFGEVPNSKVLEIARYPRIMAMDVDHAGAPELDNHKHSLGLVTGFWANSITGGPVDVGVLDTGVQQSHPALNSHPFETNFGPTDPDGHGTGIAGIMASTNSTYTGMAFGCGTISVAQAGGNSTSMSGLNYLVTGVTDKAENINYSFGNGRANDTDYSPFDQFFDGAIDTFNIMVSKSTGNGGFGTTTITHPAPAFNLLASANMDDLNSQNRNTHIITSSSSRGPTLGGRKKPDITAPGTNSMTTNRTGTFSNLGGTSSASPHTGGGIVLTRQMGATTTYGAKAVLLNAVDAWTDGNTQTTADDGPVPGSLWNKTFGWGYLDLGEAYANASDLFEHEIPAPVGGARNFKLYKGHMFAGEKATLVWNRHVVHNGISNPTQVEGLSNLDLVVYNRQTNTAVGTSNSSIDNVEQVDVDADGPVVLKVYTTGNFDPQVPSEDYGLATEEDFEASNGITFAITPSLPATAQPGSNVQVSVQVTNTSILPAHDVDVSISGATVQNGANPQTFATIPPGQSVQAVWTITAQGAAGQQQLTFTASSDSYGETFDDSVNANLNVGGSLVNPTSHTLVTGFVAGGTLSSVNVSDNSYFSFNPGIVLSALQSPVVIELRGNSVTAIPNSLAFVIESAGSSVNLQQKIEMFDFVNQQWVEADIDNLTTTDTTYTANAPGPPTNFITPATGSVAVRVSIGQTGPIFAFPWTYRIDLAGWAIN
jgi:serine protease AprX